MHQEDLSKPCKFRLYCYNILGIWKPYNLKRVEGPGIYFFPGIYLDESICKADTENKQLDTRGVKRECDVLGDWDWRKCLFTFIHCYA